jgi:proteasome accessory factor B
VLSLVVGVRRGRGHQQGAGTRGHDAASPPDRRLLELLLLLLNAGRPLSRAEIFDAIPAYRTGNPAAGERKFERDKKDLRELGVPLADVVGQVQAYAVEREAFELPPLDLDDEERAALVLAAEAVRGAEGLAYRDLVDEALRKLTFERPGGASGDLPPHLAVALPARGRGLGVRRTLTTLTRAIEGHKRVTMTYARPEGGSTHREVDPYAVVYRSGDWLLVGYCHLRRAPRTFRVDRIRGLRLAPRPGTPDFEIPPDWDLTAFLRRSPWVFQAGSSQVVDVVLDVGPDRAWMADEEFGPDVRREALGDGWVRVRFRSGNPEYVVTRVLDAAGHLRLREPRDLRERIRSEAEAVAAHYSSEGGAP